MCKCAPTTSSNLDSHSCSCSGTVLVDPRNCLRHQAPQGYHYIWDNTLQKCILVNNVTGAIVDQTLTNVPAVDSIINPSDTVNKVTAFIKANPLWSAGIAIGGYYFFTKHK